MRLRLANIKDTPALLHIYQQYIETPVTFECKAPDQKEFLARVEEIICEYPYLVCEDREKVIGYAYAHRHMEREAYQWNAELSVYLDGERTAMGIGKKLYNTLMEILKLQGVRTVYGGVTVPNIRSEKMHLSLGFKETGRYHNAGYKCGKWHDVVWFEKQIAAYGPDPMPLININEISDKELNLILDQSNNKI